jgi:DNA recombination protein RmuC
MEWLNHWGGAIVGLLAGLALGWFWGQQRLSRLRAEWQAQQNEEALAQQALNQQLAQREQNLQALEQQYQALKTQWEALEQAHQTQAQQHAALSERNQAQKEQLAQLQTQLEKQQTQWQSQLQDKEQKLAETQAALSEAKTQQAALETEKAANETHFKQRLAELDEQKAILKKEFENLANQILERKSENFKQLNQESIQQLLSPMQKEMQAFKARMEHIYEKEGEQRIALKTELKHLQQLNQEITQQAEALTKALKGQKKTQGNWGELMLENVLASSGLRLNEDYKREVSFNTEEGRQRPDAVVYLPQNKHIIIDAKTSLVAYTRYVNAETEAEANQALKEHVQAVSDRIQELSDRNYYQIEGLNSPEVVMMFMPIESAYVEALKVQPDLYQKAIEQHVLVVTPTTLLTSLNMVRQLWQFEDQNKHTAELAKRAEQVYNKLETFLGSMQKLGRQLESAQKSYDTAFGQLYSGKGSLIKRAAEFKQLGVSVKKELPPELVEKAQLELPQEITESEVADSAQNPAKKGEE